MHTISGTIDRMGIYNIRIDFTGVRFGKLVVLRKAPNRGRRTVWTCLCDCGVEKDIGTDALRQGNAVSCGCWKLAVLAKRSITHGQTMGERRTPEYNAWNKAKARCGNPNNKKYPDYGERGISVCHEWKSDFMAFLNHIGPRPSPLHSIDRIDNSKNYEPGNVRWATAAEQAKNRRSTIRVDWLGQNLCLKDVAKQENVYYPMLVYHFHQGMPLSDCISLLKSKAYGTRATKGTSKNAVVLAPQVAGKTSVLLPVETEAP